MIKIIHINIFIVNIVVSMLVPSIISVNVYCHFPTPFTSPHQDHSSPFFIFIVLPLLLLTIKNITNLYILMIMQGIITTDGPEWTDQRRFFFIR